MTIASEITKLNTNLTDSYTAVSNKGGTIPSSQNFDNLATSIATIPTGTTPTGTLSITANGVYDVTNYASVNVRVAGDSTPMFPKYNFAVLEDGSVSGLFILTGDVDDDGNPIVNVLTDAVNGDISYAMLYPDGSYEYIWVQDSVDTDNPIVHLSLGAVTAMGNNYTISFDTVDHLSSVDLSGLVVMSDHDSVSFTQCRDLTSVDLSGLTTVSGYRKLANAFSDCTSLTTVNLSGLTSVSGQQALQYAFSDCSSLTSVSFPSLTTISDSFTMRYAFAGCTSLTTLSFFSLNSNSFGTYTNQFNTMLSRVTGCTVHFPSNLQSVIGSWSDVTNGFGGTNTVVLFDLPATT